MGADNILSGIDNVGNLSISEAHTLGAGHEFMVDILNGTSGDKSMASLDNVVDLVQIPLKIERSVRVK